MHTRSWLYKHAYVETEKQVGWGLENDIVFFYLLHMGRSPWLVVALEGLRINKEALVSIFLKRKKEVDYKVVEKIRTWYIRLPVFWFTV